MRDGQRIQAACQKAEELGTRMRVRAALLLWARAVGEARALAVAAMRAVRPQTQNEWMP